MTPFCPAYPAPRKSRASTLLMFFSARHSWLDALYERSYAMHMGEVHLPGLDLYMVNDPALVRRVMQDEADNFPKSPLLGEALKPLLGESIFTTNGAQWQRQRRMMNPAFEQARLQVAFPKMREATADMLERLARLPDGAEYDLEVEMTHVTADIIFRTIFSTPMRGEDARRIFEAFARFQALAPRLLLPSIYGVRWLVFPWDAWRSRRAAREIRGLLEKLIRPRFEAHRVGRPGGETDILQAFMDARDEATGQPFGFDELVDQVAMLFLAGHETSASALTWAAHLLAHSPHIQDRMVAEHRDVIGAREPAAGDMKQLTLTWNVFRETLRLFPPVGFMARQATQGCPMRKKQVEAGSTIVVAPWLIQRHREIWPQPDAFDPDRYEDEASREPLRRGYLPFGMGPRVCLGAAFALQEAALILSSLVRHHRLTPVPGHEPRPVGRLTIRSANGVRLQLHRRAAA
ncbi:cytochrome P450 [Ramlibacter rhizophilus]|uniref:Cytochrome P450 n=1 Tax=Ramlibacter rhizophilus TaxID=1781167 RepID=A0A4Z0BKR7_9BURK|nr:cytochrome P450 [Ramlibacter rhizophilus]TFY99915.1 cytochrome P450 [Ramlibacter rhizophilus]